MIAIVSDIHGNLPALRSVLERIDQLGCEKIISLGDISGYYAQPGECLEMLLERNAFQLLGNHDYYLVNGLTCSRSRIVSELIHYQRKIVSPQYIEYISTLKPRLDDGEKTFVHGSWDDPLEEYLYSVSESKLRSKSQLFFSGHTHVQSIERFKDKTYCNPGSVGQPRDGDARAAFATLDGENISLDRVEYDIDETVHAMRAAGFSDPKLWEGLYIGAQIGGRIDKIIVEQRDLL